ncbi:MAG: PPC domain-containing DNA-binding protein [Candidatus Hodarchaeales archaeon]|jgi:predicted DNA-binding protein with PD1-like motif
MIYIKQSPKFQYLIRLEKGEDILSALQQFCASHSDIGAGSIEGIGAVSVANIGFYNGSKYLENLFSENLEILSLIGNIASNQIVHLHGIFGRSDGTCLGGHILPGCLVSFTCEIQMTVFDPPVFRERDAETNLLLLKLPEKIKS